MSTLESPFARALRALVSPLCAALVLLTSGCGGQSGAEGRSHYPGPGAQCVEPTVSELPFDAADIPRLVEGRHESTLGWRGPGALQEAAAERLVLEVTQRSEPRVSLRCGGVVFYDADLRMQLPGGREAAFEGYVHGTEHGAAIFGRAGLDVSERLEIPGPRTFGYSKPRYEVSAWIDRTGLQGVLNHMSESNADCERARWPADRSCATSERELPYDAKFGEFDFDQAVRQFAGASPLALEWQGGERTTLELTLERGEAPVCAGVPASDQLPNEFRGQRLSTQVRVHAQTADGRVDADMTATLSVRWVDLGEMPAPAASFGEYELRPQLFARGSGRVDELFQSELEAERAGPMTFQQLDLSLSPSSAGATGSIYLSTLELDAQQPQIAQSGAAERGSLDGACLEGASTQVGAMRTGTIRPMSAAE